MTTEPDKPFTGAKRARMLRTIRSTPGGNTEDWQAVSLAVNERLAACAYLGEVVELDSPHGELRQHPTEPVPNKTRGRLLGVFDERLNRQSVRFERLDGTHVVVQVPTGWLVMHADPARRRLSDEHADAEAAEDEADQELPR